MSLGQYSLEGIPTPRSSPILTGREMYWYAATYFAIRMQYSLGRLYLDRNADVDPRQAAGGWAGGEKGQYHQALPAPLFGR